MELYLLRHGIAQERGTTPTDEERALTEEGVSRMQEIVKGMQALGLEFDSILTSPLVRAKQTAELVRKGYDLKAPVTESNLLRPEAKHNDLLKELRRFDAGSRVLLVGHEPFLSELLSLLTAGDPYSAINVRKGGLALVSVPKMGREAIGCLEYLLTPKQLRCLAEAAKTPKDRS